jgi:hypothetical protein
VIAAHRDVHLADVVGLVLVDVVDEVHPARLLEEPGHGLHLREQASLLVVLVLHEGHVFAEQPLIEGVAGLQLRLLPQLLFADDLVPRQFDVADAEPRPFLDAERDAHFRLVVRERLHGFDPGVEEAQAVVVLSEDGCVILDRLGVVVPSHEPEDDGLGRQLGLQHRAADEVVAVEADRPHLDLLALVDLEHDVAFVRVVAFGERHLGEVVALLAVVPLEPCGRLAIGGDVVAVPGRQTRDGDELRRLDLLVADELHAADDRLLGHLEHEHGAFRRAAERRRDAEEPVRIDECGEVLLDLLL